MVNKKPFDNFFVVHKLFFLNPIIDGLEKDTATMHEDMFFLIDEDDFKEVNFSGKKTVILLSVSLRLNSLNDRLLNNFILELIIVETLLQERISP